MVNKKLLRFLTFSLGLCFQSYLSAAAAGCGAAPTVHGPSAESVSKGEQGERIISLNFSDGGQVIQMATDSYNMVLGTIRRTLGGAHTLALNYHVDIGNRGEYEFPAEVQGLLHLAISPEGNHVAVVALVGGKAQIFLFGIRRTPTHPQPELIRSGLVIEGRIIKICFNNADPAKIMIITDRTIMLLPLDFFEPTIIEHPGELFTEELANKSVVRTCKIYSIPPVFFRPTKTVAMRGATAERSEVGSLLLAGRVHAEAAMIDDGVRVHHPVMRLLLLYPRHVLVFNLNTECVEGVCALPDGEALFVAADCSRYPECLIASHAYTTDRSGKARTTHTLWKHNFLTMDLDRLGKLAPDDMFLGRTRHGFFVAETASSYIDFYSSSLRKKMVVHDSYRDSIHERAISLDNECLFVRSDRMCYSEGAASNNLSFAQLYYCGTGNSGYSGIMLARNGSSRATTARWVGFVHAGASSTAIAGVYATDKHALNICMLPESWLARQHLSDNKGDSCSIM